MPSSVHSSHLKDQRDTPYALGTGKAQFYPPWWEVDKVFIPVRERTHWFLVKLQLPSLKTVVYDSLLKYRSDSDLKDIICMRWTEHLPQFLDAISYWTRSGYENPNNLKVMLTRDETTPQQARIDRGDCGPFVCLCLEHMARGDGFLPPRDRDRCAVRLWFRHFMAREIYSRRCLPASHG